MCHQWCLATHVNKVFQQEQGTARLAICLLASTGMFIKLNTNVIIILYCRLVVGGYSVISVIVLWWLANCWWENVACGTCSWCTKSDNCRTSVEPCSLSIHYKELSGNFSNTISSIESNKDPVSLNSKLKCKIFYLFLIYFHYNFYY